MKRNVIEFTRASDTPDADFSDVRGNAVLEKLLRRYPQDAQYLERAHELLKDDPNYAAAMHRVANSLHDERIRVFISYQHGVDTEAARFLAEVFRELSDRKVVVTFADEFTAKISGQDYKSEIEAAIKASHWFVILVSESREPSGWCMFETGLFRASITSRKVERLICLHHPSAALPSAIDGFQAVPSDAAKLERFLDGLLRQPDPLPGWPPLNPALTDQEIATAAARIARALKPPRRPVAFNYALTLDVRDPARLKDASDLDACEIETDRLTADLFGKVHVPATWGQLVENVWRREEGGRWIDELIAIVKKSSAGNVFRPITGTFESAVGGRVMRPVVQAMEHDGIGGDFRFHLFFIEEFSAPQQERLPEHRRALLNALRMHHRVRWEVLERFGQCPWTEEDVEACAKALSRIEREFQASGGADAAVVARNFEGNVAQEIEAIAEDWQELRGPMQGKLSLAMQTKEGDRIRRYFNQCRDLNRRFLELTYPLMEQLTQR